MHVLMSKMSKWKHINFAMFGQDIKIKYDFLCIAQSKSFQLDTPWRQLGNSGTTSKLEGNKSENKKKSDLVAYNCKIIFKKTHRIIHKTINVKKWNNSLKNKRFVLFQFRFNLLWVFFYAASLFCVDTCSSESLRQVVSNRTVTTHVSCMHFLQNARTSV